MGETRDIFVQKMRAGMDHWNNDIDKLESNSIRAGAAVRVEMQKHIEDLKAKRKDFQDKLGRLNKAGEEAWGNLQAGVDAAWKSLDDSIQSAKTKYK